MTTPSDTVDRRHVEPDLDRIRRNWPWLAALGALLIVGGVIAVAAPVVASIAVTLIVGGVFLAGGVLKAIHAFRARGWRAGAWHGLSAALYLLGGALLLLDPLAGAVALTVVLGAVFLVDGALRIGMGVNIRPDEGWGWLAAGGALSVLLGLVILLFLPASSLTSLGLIAGVSLLFEGWSFLFLALAARREPHGTRGA